MLTREADIYALVLGTTIAQLRARRGLAQAALADRLSLGQSSLSRFELGQVQPEPYVVEKLAALLGLSPEQFARCVTLAFQRTEAAARGALRSRKEPWWEEALRVGGHAGVAGLVAFAVAATLTAEVAAPASAPVGRPAR